MKLENIATLSVGQILTRVATDENSEIQYKVLQPKAIGNNVIKDEDLTDVRFAKDVEREKFTREGDIVMKLSTPYDAVVIDENHVDLVIPSFCAVIRTEEGINPYYVCALINSSYIKEQLKARMAGTVRPMMKISDLRTVKMPKVSNDKMKSIGDEYQLSLKKLDLLTRIINSEKEIMDNKLLSTVLEDESND